MDLNIHHRYKIWVCAFACFVIIFEANAQTIRDSLFSDAKPLFISMRLSIREIKASKNDSVYRSQMLYFGHNQGRMDSMIVKMKARGNFRHSNCYYPQLWIKPNKKKTAGTVFEGHQRLKLVLPCKNQAGNTQIVREYLCYKLYELISPYAFQTRLVKVEFSEPGRKRDKKSDLYGIFIEDVKKAAGRLNAKLQPDLRLHPALFNDTNAARLYLFEYMISNTDWSIVYQHNTRLISFIPRRFISIPYDFDMSGLVDAPYSVVSVVAGEELAIDNVRQRIYRGFCIKSETMEFVKNEFLAKESVLMEAPDQFEGWLDPRDARKIKAYLAEFFNDLKKQNSFKQYILNRCRPAN